MHIFLQTQASGGDDSSPTITGPVVRGHSAHAWKSIGSGSVGTEYEEVNLEELCYETRDVSAGLMIEAERDWRNKRNDAFQARVLKTV